MWPSLEKVWGPLLLANFCLLFSIGRFIFQCSIPTHLIHPSTIFKPLILNRVLGVLEPRGEGRVQHGLQFKNIIPVLFSSSFSRIILIRQSLWSRLKYDIFDETQWDFIPTHPGPDESLDCSVIFRSDGYFADIFCVLQTKIHFCMSF